MSLPEAPQPSVTTAPPPAAPVGPSSGFAIAALIGGIIAFLGGLVPAWGLISGIAAVALGIAALMRRQNKGLALTGLILGGIAALTSLIATIAVIGGAMNLRDSDSALAPITTRTAAPSPTATSEPVATKVAEPTPTVEAPPPPPPAPVETVSQTNAKRKAQSYLDYSAFSRTGLIGQLEFEGFSTDDATYGTDAVGADWNAQAVLKAQSYLEYSAFSRSGLIDQLVFEGFSPDEAEFGVNSVGL